MKNGADVRRGIVRREIKLHRNPLPLDAGEMPPLRPFLFITDYSPGDFATMLQAGGIQLLDLETLTARRNDESVIRWGLARHCENGSRCIPKLCKPR